MNKEKWLVYISFFILYNIIMEPVVVKVKDKYGILKIKSHDIYQGRWRSLNLVELEDDTLICCGDGEMEIVYVDKEE